MDFCFDTFTSLYSSQNLVSESFHIQKTVSSCYLKVKVKFSVI